MLNEVYVIYDNLVELNKTKGTGIDFPSLRRARELHLNEMAEVLRQNDIRRAKQMSFELLIFDNFMNDKLSEMTTATNISEHQSVII